MGDVKVPVYSSPSQSVVKIQGLSTRSSSSTSWQFNNLWDLKEKQLYINKVHVQSKSICKLLFLLYVMIIIQLMYLYYPVECKTVEDKCSDVFIVNPFEPTGASTLRFA